MTVRDGLDAGEIGYGFWQATLDSLTDSLAVLTARGAVVAVNRAWDDFAAANGGVDVGVGANYLEVCDRAGLEDSDAAEVACALRDLASGVREEFELVYPCHAPWEERWFSLRVVPFHGSGVRRLVVTHHEVTLRYQAQRLSEQQRDLLSSVGAAIIAVDLDAVITQWSDGARELYGWTATEVLGRTVGSVLAAPADGPAAREAMAALQASDDALAGEFEAICKDGRTVCVGVRGHVLRDADGAVSGMIGISLDVTERREIERQLRSARDFLMTVTQTMPDGLMVLDADGRITLANEAAQTMLGWEAAELVGELMHDKIHALKPDGTIMPNESCPITLARSTASSIRVDDDVFQRRDGTFLPVAYSAAPFLTEARDSGSVVVFGDITEAKERERRVQQELDALSWVGRIRDALAEDRFVLYAQPIIEIATGLTVQHELLVRMVSPSGEIIAPAAFLPVAEEHGLISAIDRRVFEMALDYASAGHPVEVNLSADSISDPSLYRFVEERLQARDVDPRLVVFEITETALIRNEAVAQAFIENVRRLNCAVALDDFGTGYGSFRYLKHLPVTLLKIDQEFISDLDGVASKVNQHVVGAIVTLARGMGQKTVAEGVETESALDLLRTLGVDHAQGFLFARPAPAVDVFAAVEQSA